MLIVACGRTAPFDAAPIEVPHWLPAAPVPIEPSTPLTSGSGPRQTFPIDGAVFDAATIQIQLAENTICCADTPASNAALLATKVAPSSSE
jgi:hypothetical protein